MGGHQTSAISFNSSHFGKLVLLFCDAESIRNINKIGFIMISVSVHVTFKYVKVTYLNCFFHIDPTHKKLVAEMHPLGSFQSK